MDIHGFYKVGNLQYVTSVLKRILSRYLQTDTLVIMLKAVGVQLMIRNIRVVVYITWLVHSVKK